MTEILFHAIKTFVTDLADVYSSDIHPLALYDRLLHKTKIVHADAVEKHISAFRKFYDSNKENIIENKTTFTGVIEYSQKVFIDMNNVYKLAEKDNDTQKSIHLHLLTISALLDPHGGAKEILTSLKCTLETSDTDSVKTLRFEGDTNEENFLNDIMSTVEKSVNPETVSSPNDAIEKMMGSGVMTDIVSNISGKIASGNLDIGKMFGVVQKMVGNLTKDAPNDPQISQMLGMMNMLTVNRK
jgi:hypothetical protein